MFFKKKWNIIFQPRIFLALPNCSILEWVKDRDAGSSRVMQNRPSVEEQMSARKERSRRGKAKCQFLDGQKTFTANPHRKLQQIWWAALSELHRPTAKIPLEKSSTTTTKQRGVDLEVPFSSIKFYIFLL